MGEKLKIYQKDKNSIKQQADDNSDHDSDKNDT